MASKKNKNNKKNVKIENIEEKKQEKQELISDKSENEKKKENEEKLKVAQDEIDKNKKDEEDRKENKTNETVKKEESENKKDIEKKDKDKNENKKITKEEFTQNTIDKKKKQTYIIFIVTLVIIFLLFISIIFAVINMNKNTYINGIFIKDVELSGLTIDEGKAKLEENISSQLNSKIELTYNGETIASIVPSDIEFKYDFSNQLKEAYKIGRSGNIFKNNYDIVFTAILKKKIDIEYTYNEELLNSIVNNLDSNIPGLVINPSHYIEGTELIIVPGTDGIIVEKEKLKENIIENIKNYNSEEIKSGEDYNKIEIPTIDKKAEEIDIDKIYKEIYCEPKNAYYVEDPFELYLDEDGVDFAITIEEAKNIISEPAEEYKIPLKITKAEITISDIDSSAFRYQVSTFSTNYDPGYTSRVNNLQLAAGKINGTVLRPGETFSFNEVVGKRTIEAGYTDAKIFVNGEVVDGTGGGICQISTTLYNAVLLANLQVTDRRNHNYTTSYVKPGRDATVVYGAIDFKFVNNRKYPIKIESSVNGGVVKFSIYGVQEENEYEVKIIPIVTDSIPNTTEYINDSTLAEGSEVVKQLGTTGCKVTTYKEVYLNGGLVSKEVISNDTYKAMARIVRRGTKKISVPTVSAPVEETPPIVEQPNNLPEIQEPIQEPVETDVQDTTM